jgi:rhamnulokinase
MPRLRFLAFDLGAESGRAVLGSLEAGQLSLRELYRFPNGPVRLLGRDHWNLPGLWEEVQTGVRRCTREAGLNPQSLAVDTWGVDFGFVAADGSLLGLPLSYRGPHTAGAMEDFLQRVAPERVYELTGVQFLPFNTLFQLAALVRDRSPVLDSAAGLLFMPDLFQYLLTGRKSSEFTIASTSQLFDPRARAWSGELLAALGLSESLMPEVRPPGTILGSVDSEAAEATGLPSGTPVVATASHDTASAVAAVPAEGQDWAYISSGTWSLVGVECAGPVITPRTLALNFTNEGGLGGRVRLLKNVTGLWLLQQCRRSWGAGRRTLPGYDELVQSASTAPAFRTLVDPDDPSFLNPTDMPEAIRAFARRSGQVAPETEAATVRCILESLALKYRQVLVQLAEVSPRPIGRLHIIGGGSRNDLLCRFTAAACGLPVMAGPAEATAAGNVLGQALALGAVGSLEDIRTVMRDSFELASYEPADTRAWDDAFGRFLDLGGTGRA